jgi:RNA polymerase sigma-70 factor (ECF subfamily)
MAGRLRRIRCNRSAAPGVFLDETREMVMPMRKFTGESHLSTTSDADIFRQLYPSLRRYAAFIAPLATDPDDIVQETLTRALRRGPLHELDDPGAYLRRSIHNLVANGHRSGERRQRAMHRHHPSTLAEDSYPSDVASRLEAVDPVDRALIYLIDLEGFPTSDAADLCGLKPATARSRVARARARLQTAEKRESP